MSYKIKYVTIENFKYIKSEIKIDFINYNINILDGPNGYGKSTLFDALELLITGSINHFNKNLKNRGEESLNILANDQNKNIIISCDFNDVVNKKSFIIKRIFNCIDDFSNSIYIISNDKEQKITQNELFDLLEINQNLFDIGIYISQSDSLNFLQQKYKDRKDRLTNILDSTNISKEIDSLTEIVKKLKEKHNNDKSKFEDHIRQLKKIIEAEQIKMKNYNDAKIVKYQKLFDDEFDFDKENVDVNTNYDILIKPLKNLKLYINDYDNYVNTLFNQKIDECVKINKREFIAIYYKNEINEIKSNKLNLINLSKLETYLIELTNGNYLYDEFLLSYLGIETELKEKIIQLINQKQFLIKQMNNNQQLINKFIKNRSLLISNYNEAVETELWNSNTCPLCGNESKNLLNLFNNTLNLLKENGGSTQEILNSIEQQISSTYTNTIIPKILENLKSNEELITKYKKLNKYDNIDLNNIMSILAEFQIESFKNNSDIVDLELFNKDYSELLNKINLLKKNVKKVISDQEIDNYDFIKSKYYNKSNHHTIEDINNKIYYITFQYSINSKRELDVLQEKLSILNTRYINFNDRAKKMIFSLEKLLKKYKDSYKIYQSNIANSIKVPLFLFSGKIIQNYPLGLGIFIDINQNQIVFKTENKDFDIFNILSTGQLNGVILSVLLSVNSIFTSHKGLNLLLIDDPLQSIDDISSYSFADLISQQFNDTQIIMSTHEDDKSNLFKFKSHQLNLASQSINMQDKYLNCN